MPLFEVEIENRVVKCKFRHKRIRGRQGDWYIEKLYYLADSEEEAKKFAAGEIGRRRIIGVPSITKRNLKREIKINDIRRLA